MNWRSRFSKDRPCRASSRGGDPTAPWPSTPAQSTAFALERAIANSGTQDTGSVPQYPEQTDWARRRQPAHHERRRKLVRDHHPPHGAGPRDVSRTRSPPPSSSSCPQLLKEGALLRSHPCMSRKSLSAILFFAFGSFRVRIIPIWRITRCQA